MSEAMTYSKEDVAKRIEALRALHDAVGAIEEGKT